MRKVSDRSRIAPVIAPVFLLAAGATVPRVQAQDIVKVGGEIPVNATTIGDQGEPDVVMEDDGSFVVVWSGAGGIHGQRFEWDATPVGGEMLIAASAVGPPVVVRPLPISSGLQEGFEKTAVPLDPITMWIEAQNELRARTFVSGSDPVSLGSTAPSGPPPKVAPSSGGYRVAHRNADDTAIEVQRRDADNALVGELELDTPPPVSLDIFDELQSVFIQQARTPELPLDRSRVEALNPVTKGAPPPVSLLVSYIWNDTTTGADVVSGQFFDAMDDPVGSEFQINDPLETTIKDDLSTAANETGVVMAVWRSGFTGPKIVMRLLDAAGPLPGSFLVSADQFSALRRPAVAAMGERFLVTWERSPGSPTHIVARIIDVDDPLVPSGGVELAVSGSTDWNRSDPAVAADDQGRAVVVWQSFGQDGDQGGIYAQRLRFETGILFLDGFESGDSSAWSSQVP